VIFVDFLAVILIHTQL